MECINNKPYHMKSVCYNLSVGEQALYQVPEWRAQIHADHLHLLPALKLAQIAFQCSTAFTFKDFVNAMVAQIGQSHCKLMPLCPSPMNAMLINSQNLGTWVLQLFAQQSLMIPVQLAFNGAGAYPVFLTYGFVAYAIGTFSGERVVEPGIAPLPFSYTYVIA